METDFVWNALSMSTESTNIFHGYALDYIRSRAEKNDPFVRQSSFKAVAAEEVADPLIRSQSVTVEEKTLAVQ
jgi:hypothetical protein